MKTYKRICIEDIGLVDLMGQKFFLKRGEEYITGAREGSKVMVFTNFWVKVPIKLFAGAVKFT